MNTSDEDSEAAYLGALDAAHLHLLRRYSIILIHSTSLPFLVDQSLSPRRAQSVHWLLAAGRSWAIRPLVQPFIESHINSRLGQLDRIYLWVKDFTAAATPLAGWIDETRENLADHQAQLSGWTSWASLLRLFGVPALAIVAGFAGAASGDTLLAIAGWALVLIIYVGLMGGFSFRYKRSLFLGAPGLLPQQEGEDQNTYRAEDELWGALGLRKTPEPPLDLVFAALPFLAYGLTGLIGNLVQGKVWLALLVGVPLTLAGIRFLVAIRSRKWR